MPSILKVRIERAQNLPVMATDGFTDAYVVVEFEGGDKDRQDLRTAVVKDSLSPSWQEQFRIEVEDDIELQDQPLR